MVDDSCSLLDVSAVSLVHTDDTFDFELVTLESFIKAFFGDARDEILTNFDLLDSFIRFTLSGKQYD